MRGGRVARSPSFICVAVKIMVRQAKPTKRPIIRELCQGYVEPPHCNARRRQTTAGMRTEAPRRSSSRMQERRDWPEALDWRGMLRKIIITAIENAPIGRLLKTTVRPF